LFDEASYSCEAKGKSHSTRRHIYVIYDKQIGGDDLTQFAHNSISNAT
jgi:hypothetical protein